MVPGGRGAAHWATPAAGVLSYHKKKQWKKFKEKWGGTRNAEGRRRRILWIQRVMLHLSRTLSALVLMMQIPWCVWFFVKLAAAVESAVGQVPREHCLSHFVRRFCGHQVQTRGKKQVLRKTWQTLCVFWPQDILGRDIPLALSSSHIALLMDAFRKSCVHSCSARLERTVDFVCVCWAGEGSAKEKTAFDSNGYGLFSFQIINCWCHELLCWCETSLTFYRLRWKRSFHRAFCVPQLHWCGPANQDDMSWSPKRQVAVIALGTLLWLPVAKCHDCYWELFLEGLRSSHVRDFQSSQ